MNSKHINKLICEAVALMWWRGLTWLLLGWVHSIFIFKEHDGRRKIKLGPAAHRRTGQLRTNYSHDTQHGVIVKDEKDRPFRHSFITNT